MYKERTTKTISMDGDFLLKMIQEKFPDCHIVKGKKALSELSLQLRKVTEVVEEKEEKKPFDRESWEPKEGIL